jgi:hypothetical protein
MPRRSSLGRVPNFHAGGGHRIPSLMLQLTVAPRPEPLTLPP